MLIIYDAAKRQINLQKHGLDFDALDAGFFLSSRVVSTKADRFMAIGEFKGQAVIAVVFKPLGNEALSVISMRTASRKERTIL
jgi:uncharacterized protein